MDPYLNAPVLYTDDMGLVNAALVIGTIASIDQQSVTAGQVPAIDTATHAHLFAMTPGARGAGAGWWPVFNIPYVETPGVTPNTWSWPPAVPA